MLSNANDPAVVVVLSFAPPAPPGTESYPQAMGLYHTATESQLVGDTLSANTAGGQNGELGARGLGRYQGRQALAPFDGLPLYLPHVHVLEVPSACGLVGDPVASPQQQG